jgi:predicted RecA/RadA family phage recombinase
MATNIKYEPGYTLGAVVVTNPAAPVSNDPVRCGSLTGIALTDEGEGGNAATETTVNFGPFIAEFSVFDEATTGIAIGDPLYYDDVQGQLDNDAVNGYFFGIALAVVLANATTTILVMHVPTPGAGAYAALGVSTAKIANGAVTTAKIAALNVTDALMSAPAALTLNSMRTAKFEWDFATDAHAVGTVAFRGATLPAKARIVKGACYVKTALTGGAGATAAIQVTGANDLVAAAVVAGVPWSTADAMVPVVPVNTTATHIKSEAAGGKPSLVIGTNDLTAGHIDVWLDYTVVD